MSDISLKYTTLVVCPSRTNGSSTGCAPIQVRVANVATRAHRPPFFRGLNFIDFVLGFFSAGAYMMTTEAARAITPPSFDGIDRKIAYANRKYHSGWM